MPEEIMRPFRVAVPDEALADLRQRLGQTRWAPEPAGGDVGYGVSNARVRRLADYWMHRYDWRQWEARLNEIPQFTTTIDGTNVHFLHVRSPEPDAVPLILSHGWPGSVFEYLNVIGPLSDPARYGLSTDIAFDLVVPSLPGFGFSGPTPDTGWGVQRIAEAWVVLMQRLGYRDYGTVGNDWGSGIAPEIGRIAPDCVIGAHVTQTWSDPPADAPELVEQLTPRDQAAMKAWATYLSEEAAYGMVQGQQPQTLAHALSDSPAGLLGWNIQAMREGSLDTEAILTHVATHWLTGTGGSAIRIYAEEMRQSPVPPATDVPLGVAQFAGDLPSVHAFTDHIYNLKSWSEFDRGSHYGAYDAPDLMISDLRQFFNSLRPPTGP